MENMFCFQCQETAKNEGCKFRGVCGKQAQTANLQDLLIYIIKGIGIISEKLDEIGESVSLEVGPYICVSLFKTITNANFDDESILKSIEQGLKLKLDLKNKFLKLYSEKNGKEYEDGFHESVDWNASSKDEYIEKAFKVGVLSEENINVRSLNEVVIYGIKGIAAYAEHAFVLGFEKKEIYDNIIKLIASTTKTLDLSVMISNVLKTGETAVSTMALLDEANTSTYGHPEITEVNIGVGNRPGILVSGHDLKDFEELLEQSKDSGIDIYTHSEMLPANYYPKFKQYSHFVGNYGNAWWKQSTEFESFNGPILMTTNCITPVKDSYKNRIFTTGAAGYPGIKHIGNRERNGKKDFSEIIELAKRCESPKEIEKGKIIGGFAHNQVLSLADKIVTAVKEGKIKRFIVMAGCDGRMKNREYFTEVAKNLPKEAVILTAGCAKYRYNKLNLGDIDGIPRVLDAGQCNDSYSLAVIALKLKEVFGLEDINELPISFDLGWYEQKAVAVLLGLLFLGVKGIRLGPTIPAFLSHDVVNVLVENFGIKLIGEVEQDIADMMTGK